MSSKYLDVEISRVCPVKNLDVKMLGADLPGRLASRITLRRRYAVETPQTHDLDAVATPAKNGAKNGAKNSSESGVAPADPQACMDEVDRLVEAWRRERPDLDVAPLEVLSRVSRLARHLDRARRTAFAEHDLEPWEFDVLSALRRAGAPYQLTPSKLLTQTLVTSGTMTNRIDRLAAKDLVKRLPDPGDRRGVLVQLSDTGRERVDGAFEGLLAQERELLGGLSAEDRRALAGLLRTLVLPFDN
jgi:DNA-binding MarR family transcriptional regulator